MKLTFHTEDVVDDVDGLVGGVRLRVVEERGVVGRDAPELDADVARRRMVGRDAEGRVEAEPGQQNGAKFPTSKAHISAVFHSFRLIFGRAIISRSGLEAWVLFSERARAEHSR